MEEGQADVWDTGDPSAVPGMLALQAGLAVRDHFPAVFLDGHRELFAARHRHMPISRTSSACEIDADLAPAEITPQDTAPEPERDVPAATAVDDSLPFGASRPALRSR